MIKKLTFLPQNKICQFEGHPSILEVALMHEISLNHSCGGMGSCTTCKVNIIKGLEELNAPNELEYEHIRARGFSEAERLACQTDAVDGLVIEVPLEKEFTKSQK